MPTATAAPTRDFHPSKASRTARSGTAAGNSKVAIPAEGSVELSVAGKVVALTNLHKPFWPELGISKGDLIQYYADIAPVLLPHLRDRAMVMKRYPHGAHGEFFFMKRAPTPRPEWILSCSIEDESAYAIDSSMLQD